MRIHRRPGEQGAALQRVEPQLPVDRLTPGSLVPSRGTAQRGDHGVFPGSGKPGCEDEGAGPGPVPRLACRAIGDAFPCDGAGAESGRRNDARQVHLGATGLDARQLVLAQRTQPCTEGVGVIEAPQLEGKREVAGKDLVNGRGLAEGSVLAAPEPSP